MEDKKAVLLQKIKELAERGVEGEKESAQKLLARLMEKYGITEEALLKEKVDCEWFRYREDLQRRLLNQIIYMVMGNAERYKRTGGRHKLIGVYCTACQRLEIEANYEFFKNALNKELEVFYSAFCAKNHLFPPKGMERESTPEDEISELEALKIKMMMEGMDRHTLRKMIGGGR